MGFNERHNRCGQKRFKGRGSDLESRLLCDGHPAPTGAYIGGSRPTVFGISGRSGAGALKGNMPKISGQKLEGCIGPYSLTDHIHEREASYHLGKQVDRAGDF
ncbi:hypothetical protein PGTUg99_001428 [Puccinia graminis f. sp. tritici]|uniref:N-acetyl-gamma-glutamyl-phosphate reductase dimerisation domain-containing protein n=2 Tax=Puccinia graminis f. sp. tritici TaxID=56615 RepID=E3KL28_PUCGT|nr:uncharacterized protein PGTG_11172 [Puccinia graminis f. sp. tritici CRL 75-36-700-3]EFP85003.2 hypothetical protein PGTG_11172 [Puccinia graminis f. sp. tritici CRL 75-36-700-3]KAA1068032.1 hypothetical protein PGTUg99_001428 [Puccinia graminis f. sp. tritici]